MTRRPSRMRRPVLSLIAAPAMLLACSTHAEEGMWTFDQFPISAANRALGTHIDQAWIDRLRLASVRVNGASGGFVSAQGLVLTNEHVVAQCVQDLSTIARDYTATGFTPASRVEERRCPGYSAEVLTKIEDVTPAIRAATNGLSDSAFAKARDAAMSRIEKQSCPSGMDYRCEVVSLYGGGQYKLYVYRRHTDVRLAFAPEHRAAAFGGDLDNFSFPRFDIDAAFLRVYHDGNPLPTPQHLRWNSEPPRLGQPVFLAGSPFTSQRLLTQAQLATVADVMLPLQQQIRSELRGRLIRFSQESEANAFSAANALAGIENSYKRNRGRQLALIDPRFMASRTRAEEDFRRRVAAGSVAAAGEDPWRVIEMIQPDARRLFPSYFLLEAEVGGFSQLYKWALDLVRGTEERAKANADRLRDYSDARLPRIEQSLFAERPVYPALDAVQFGWWLAKIREILTVDDPRVRILLGSEAPEALASRIMHETHLGDPTVRRRLWEGGRAAILASDDPLIRYVLSIDAVARTARREYEERVLDPTDRASQDLARLRFSVFGTHVAPDATGTLRLSFGTVEGWSFEGKPVGYATTFGGLWARATGAPPFDLPPRLAAARDRIPATTILNVVASTDTIGGSSGSPVVNERGEIVAANFDSTLLSQRSAYGYDRAINRSVLVTTAAITAVLRHVYGLQHLLEELGASDAAKSAAADAERVLDQAQRELAEIAHRASQARWVNSTYITDDTDAIAQRANAEQMRARLHWAKQAARFNDVPGLSADARRMLDILRQGIQLPPPDTPEGAETLSRLASQLKNTYARGKGTSSGRPINGSDMEAAMGRVRDPVRLQEQWTSWHDNVGMPMKEHYVRLVEVANQGARDLGFANAGELWRAGYDMPPERFPVVLEQLWSELKPLYEQLHCYTRARLSQYYGKEVQKEGGPIRADLLGNMWAQEWGNIYDLVAPEGIGDIGYSLTGLLNRRAQGVPEMVKTGERFFTSLGFDPLPDTFWVRSMFTKPQDREALCHAQAWDLDDLHDVRLKTCLRVNDDDFATVHHEIGHLYYYLAYNTQPPLYRAGANDGFHEAVGDFIQLSLTPDYLVKTGLLDHADVPSPDKDTGLLLRQALDKVSLVPFSLVLDRWRWGVFEGTIEPDEYQTAWDRLRLEYQGVVPPVARPADAFDAGAKFHVANVSPYSSYLIARVLQFQFYKAACDMVGWKGPLHRCSFYGNPKVGDRLKAMLAMGRSKPWPEVLKIFTGTDIMSSNAMLEYFAPLTVWLRKQNEGRSCGW